MNKWLLVAMCAMIPFTGVFADGMSDLEKRIDEEYWKTFIEHAKWHHGHRRQTPDEWCYYRTGYMQALIKIQNIIKELKEEKCLETVMPL